MTTRLLPQRSRFGEIKLTGFLGTGGFSDVYAGNLPDGRSAAVKVFRGGTFDREAIKLRLERERDIVQSLITGGVARLLDSDLEAEVPWIASELVDGPTLRESVESDGVMDENEVLGIVQSLATTLIELHGRGVAHRDITPNNVIIGPKGPVLIDFGSARADLGDGSTRSILLEGTVGYLAPEAERGEEVGRASDIFALARIAEFCLSGSDETRAALPDVLSQALSAEPDDRPAASLIAATLPASRDFAKRHSPRKIEPLPRRVPLLFTTLGLAFVLAIGVLLGFAIFNPQPTSSSSLLGVEEIEGRALASEQVLAIDVAGMSVERVRPVNTGLGASIGDLSGYRIWGLAQAETAFERCSAGDEHACDELWLGSPAGSVNEIFGGACGGRGRIFDSSCSGIELSQITPDLAEGALKVVALFAKEPGFSETESVPPEIRRRAGDLFERVERERLRGDCYLERADEASRISGTEMYVWLAAEGPDCGRNELARRAFAGIVWSPGTPLAAEWVMESTSTEAIEALLAGVSLNSSFEFFSPEGLTNSSEIFDTRDAFVAAPLGSGFNDFLATAMVFRVGSGRALEFSVERPSDLAFNFAFIPSKASPGLNGWEWGGTPAGSWWAREGGERRLISNPTDSDALLWVQVEQNGNKSRHVEWTVEPLSDETTAFGIQTVFSEIFSDQRLELQPLRSIYDGPVFSEQTGDRVFVLPVDDESSDSDPTSSTTFVTSSCAESELATSLAVVTLTTPDESCDRTILLMGDDSDTYWEIADRESDGPHFLIADAEAFSMITRNSPQSWLLAGTETSSSVIRCESENGAEVEGTNGLTLEIVISLDCPIRDQHHMDSSGGTGPQTLPIFRFVLREARFAWPEAMGSFAPQSSAELLSFSTFLSELLLEPRQ